MSRQRSKGTRWETELVDRLRAHFPHCERAPLKGIHDYGDFLAVNDWLLEAKSTATPRFLEWARICRRKAGTNRWAVLWHGDRRTDLGRPLAVLDLETFLELIALDSRHAPIRLPEATMCPPTGPSPSAP